MTDADDDGAHIQVLLLTFFFNHMRPLVEDGRIYLALPPLFKITKRGKTEEIVYAWTNEEKDKISHRGNALRLLCKELEKNI